MKFENQTQVQPEVGEGIYTSKDVAHILKLPSYKVSRWMRDFWSDHTFGIKGNRFVNFKTLIEFYTFYHLKESGLTSQRIKKIHDDLSIELNTFYPFASKIYIENVKDGASNKSIAKRAVYYEIGENLIQANKKRQQDIKLFLTPFLNKIEFNNNDIAERYFPLENSKTVVVDPKFQFGQPIITGTRIKAEIIHEFFEGGESKENICKIYHLQIRQVEDAILYYKRPA
jgi:uncharacterized protein (DUF433 family)